MNALCANGTTGLDVLRSFQIARVDIAEGGLQPLFGRTTGSSVGQEFMDLLQRDSVGGAPIQAGSSQFYIHHITKLGLCRLLMT